MKLRLRGRHVTEILLAELRKFIKTEKLGFRLLNLIIAFIFALLLKKGSSTTSLEFSILLLNPVLILNPLIPEGVLGPGNFSLPQESNVNPRINARHACIGIYGTLEIAKGRTNMIFSPVVRDFRYKTR